MSTPRPQATPSDPNAPRQPRRAPSAASRYLFVFLLGLVVGIVALVMLMRTFEGRRTWQDKYPTAAMQLMSAHAAQLRQKLDANRCGAIDALPHLEALRLLGNDLDPAFPGLAENTRFAQHTAGFRATLDRARTSPPMDCAGLKATLDDIGKDCKACHTDFRG